jgi:hypothetical protein
MVSDVLSYAVDEINSYLAEDYYDGEVRERIRAVRDVMDAMRGELDDRSGQPRELITRHMKAMDEWAHEPAYGHGSGTAA